jgi:hypothetical protein
MLLLSLFEYAASPTFLSIPSTAFHLRVVFSLEPPFQVFIAISLQPLLSLSEYESVRPSFALLRSSYLRRASLNVTAFIPMLDVLFPLVLLFAFILKTVFVSAFLLRFVLTFLSIIFPFQASFAFIPQ